MKNVSQIGAVVLALLVLTFLYLSKPKVAMFIIATIALLLLTNKWDALQANWLSATGQNKIPVRGILTDPTKTGAGTQA